MLTFRVTEKTGPLSVARVVRPEQELILVSQNGIVMRTRADTISLQGRSTQGVQVMNVDDGDRVASLAQIDLGETPSAIPPPEATPPDSPNGSPDGAPDDGSDGRDGESGDSDAGTSSSGGRKRASAKKPAAKKEPAGGKSSSTRSKRKS
jgi:DNA gyrase subunit A